LKDAPETIRILEVYRDVQAYEAHLQTPHFLKYKRETQMMVRSLSLIDVEPVAMVSK